MTNSSSPARIAGLSEIATGYAAILCDVWGVVHNGLRSFAPARQALIRFRERGGRVVLITNAPRPSAVIRLQLDVLDVERAVYDDVVTSGDVTRELIAAIAGEPIAHIGPERDLTLYDGLEVKLVSEARARFVSVTGLFDDENETADDYMPLMREWVERGVVMICANPDVVVERGDRLIPCAGALAERYRLLGGRTEIAGKPHPPIYQAALAKLAALAGDGVPRASVLAVGDGLPTDVAGANAEALDLLFVSGGIHAAAFGEPERPDPAAVASFLARAGFGARAFLPRLVW
jgi:HAD superfamily hydrolase (TIGR01459 family)